MKGISPLIAAVLLIAFTVAIATLIMGWFGTTVRETTTTISNQTTQAVDCSSASISIDAVYISSGPNGNDTVRAIVKNTGFADDLRLVSAQFYKINGDVWNQTNIDLDFDKGEIITITFNTIGGWVSCANFSKVIVTTNCGGVSDTFEGRPVGC